MNKPLDAKQSVPATPAVNSKMETPEPSLTDLVKALANQVSALTQEVSNLKKPSTPASATATPSVTSKNTQGYQGGKNYVQVNRGYPVPEGHTWADLTPAQRQEWFNNHENRWKQKYTQSAQKMGGGDMNWTRG